MSKYGIIILVILVASSVLLISSAWNDSVIVDEVPHIGAGYSYVALGDMRLNPEHPPLAKSLATFPLLFLNLNQSAFETRFWTSEVNGQWDFGRHLIFNSGVDPDIIKHWVKAPMLIFFILSAILIYIWTRNLYDKMVGLLALLLFAFSPTIMTHSRFVTTDMPALFGMLFGLYFYVKYLKHETPRNFLISSFFIGIALLTKFSTVLIIPLIMIVAFSFGLMRHSRLSSRISHAINLSLKALLIVIVGFALIVWPFYYLHVKNYPPNRQRSDTTSLLRGFGFRPLADIVIKFSDKPVLRAAAQYGLGLLMVGQRSEGGNKIYFRGEVVNSGGIKYFPLVYLIKEPLAWWLLFLIAFFGMLVLLRTRFRLYNIKKFIIEHTDVFAMVVWLAIYWIISLRSSLNIGVRHLLPIFPFMIILVSGGLAKIVKNLDLRYKKYFKTVIVILVAWFVFESLSVFPFYLTYFNQLVGGPNGGHAVVADSNLDWGQDLKRLGDYVKDNNIDKIQVDYFGWADPAYYLGSALIGLSNNTYRDMADFRKRNPNGGWLAISTTFYIESISPHRDGLISKGDYNWLINIEPVTIIGNSIRVYKL